MYRLSDLYSEVIQKELQSGCGITCENVGPEMAILNRQLTDRCSLYAFNLVTRGWAKLIYGGRTFTIHKNDFFVSTPGVYIYTKEVSDDYSCWCLMCDEASAYGIPFARKIITAAYFPSMVQEEDTLAMNDHDISTIAHRMEEIYNYLNSRHPYKDDILQSLFSLFLCELLSIENAYQSAGELNPHAIDLFLRFLQLANENFIDRHDLEFYARSLSVSSIYLSRVVKRLSNQTIKNHLDRLLAMEACYRLTNTDTPVGRIAEELHFANPASFCKFFVRQKGISPREYRNKFVS